MPSSDSSVRGLVRSSGDAHVELRPDESCERMMSRVDRAQVVAVCRHLVGDLARPTSDLIRSAVARSAVTRSAVTRAEGARR